jgi:hypothetical protein
MKSLSSHLIQLKWHQLHEALTNQWNKYSPCPLSDCGELLLVSMSRLCQLDPVPGDQRHCPLNIWKGCCFYLCFLCHPQGHQRLLNHCHVYGLLTCICPASSWRQRGKEGGIFRTLGSALEMKTVVLKAMHTFWTSTFLSPAKIILHETLTCGRDSAWDFHTCYPSFVLHNYSMRKVLLVPDYQWGTRSLEILILILYTW